MLSTTDTGAITQAAALAAIVEQELIDTPARLAESCVFSQAEYRQICWLLGKARVRTSHREITLTGPLGRVSERHGHRLYHVLERAANTLAATPWAVTFEEFEGHNTPGGGKLTW